jgi:plasmid stabilization system protein ParE
MVAELILAPEVAQDLAEAYAWYEGYQVGLGEEFLSCVEACLDGIRRNPGIHPAVHQSYQRAFVRRFPYGLFYDHEEGVVTVYGVFHTARDPHKWRRRLP